MRLDEVGDLVDGGLPVDRQVTLAELLGNPGPHHVHAENSPGRAVGFLLGDDLHEMTTSDFADFVASHQPSPKEQGAAIRLDILSIEIAGATAVARVRDDYLGMTFLDTLSLLKADGAWSIYNKLFHVEAVEG